MPKTSAADSDDSEEDFKPPKAKKAKPSKKKAVKEEEEDGDDDSDDDGGGGVRSATTTARRTSIWPPKSAARSGSGRRTSSWISERCVSLVTCDRRREFIPRLPLTSTIHNSIVPSLKKVLRQGREDPTGEEGDQLDPGAVQGPARGHYGWEFGQANQGTRRVIVFY